jgi:hypothetical protein
MAVSLSMTEGLSKLLFYDCGSFQAAFLWPGAIISPGVLPCSISIAVSLSMTPGLSTYVRGLSTEPFNSCKPFYNRRSFRITVDLLISAGFSMATSLLYFMFAIARHPSVRSEEGWLGYAAAGQPDCGAAHPMRMGTGKALFEFPP